VTSPLNRYFGEGYSSEDEDEVGGEGEGEGEGGGGGEGGGEQTGEDCAVEETCVREGDVITHLDGLRVRGLVSLRIILTHVALGKSVNIRCDVYAWPCERDGGSQVLLMCIASTAPCPPSFLALALALALPLPLPLLTSLRARVSSLARSGHS